MYVQKHHAVCVYACYRYLLIFKRVFGIFKSNHAAFSEVEDDEKWMRGWKGLEVRAGAGRGAQLR